VAGDTIKFASTAYGTITLSSGALTVATGVDIDGPGANKVTINGKNTYQDLIVEAGVTATISGLAITGGEGPANYPYGGGGINNDGDLTIDDCVITGNSAGVGGGISNAAGGVLELSGSTVSNNSAAFAGGINNLGTATITGCLVINNSATAAGGIYSGDFYGPAALTITNSVFRDNTAAFSGGGIELFAASATTVGATISGSSFANNVAGSSTSTGASGGAIAAWGNGGVNLSISGSTFNGNAASSMPGASEARSTRPIRLVTAM
jgi:hypothetical protein